LSNRNFGKAQNFLFVKKKFKKMSWKLVLTNSFPVPRTRAQGTPNKKAGALPKGGGKMASPAL